MSLLKAHIYIALLLFTISSCGSEPKNINHEELWTEYSSKLKNLVEDIIENTEKYSIGINDFPSQFESPFDDGFGIEHYGIGNSEPINPESLTIKFYSDRGLLDHYSAFIFSNDQTNMILYDEKVQKGGNDYKMQENWYYISD